MKSFLRIYSYNKHYQRGDKPNSKALKIQGLILLAVICIALINLENLDANFKYWYLDQYDRIYALLIAVVLTVIVTLNTMLKHEKVSQKRVNYLEVTYKDDYLSVIMYTVFLYFIGITFNILYATLFQYFNIFIIDVICWIIALFLLFNSIFFTGYTIEELSKLLKKI